MISQLIKSSFNLQFISIPLSKTAKVIFTKHLPISSILEKTKFNLVTNNQVLIIHLKNFSFIIDESRLTIISFNIFTEQNLFPEELLSKKLFVLVWWLSKQM